MTTDGTTDVLPVPAPVPAPAAPADGLLVPPAPGSVGRLHLGDMAEVLRRYPDDCFDAVVTDPPYGLSQEPDVAEVMRHWLAGTRYTQAGSGFMGKTWDSFVPGPEYWREILRVLKPGGHAVVFAATRTVDLMMVALRFAGFEMRDSICWAFGSGMPKSMNVGKAIDREAGATRPVLGTRSDGAGNTPESVFKREGYAAGLNTTYAVTGPATEAAKRWEGWGTTLKPAHEPIILARKPIGERTVAKNVLRHGTGGIHIDACRVGDDTSRGDRYHGKPSGGNHGPVAMMKSRRHYDDEVWQAPAGRWPANLLLCHAAACRPVDEPSDDVWDCAADCPVRLLDEQSGTSRSVRTSRGAMNSGCLAGTADTGPTPKEGTDTVRGHDDAGGASRFFMTFPAEPPDPFVYCAKASKSERNAGCAGLGQRVSHTYGSIRQDNPESLHSNFHCTVKPIRLMAYLVRLVTPPGGLVLDPFLGSGSTAVACIQAGFRCVGIEREADYLEIARARCAHAKQQRPATPPTGGGA